MPEVTTLLAFVIAALVVLVIPGPGVLYVVARSVGQGYLAGWVSVLGLATGVLVHVAAATAGLSAILLTSATAFGIVQMLGAGYLIYLGVKTLRAKSESAVVETPPALSMRRLFTDGVIVSVFNPKIAVFFLAFLPQFADPTRGSVHGQVLLLGIIYVALAVMTDGTYALLAGRLRHLLRGSVLRGPLPRYVCGGLYIGLGLSAALSGRRG